MSEKRNFECDPVFGEMQCRFNRLALDQLKKHQLRMLFQTLMSEPANRTVADINALIKIMLTPVKRLGNSSVVYHLCRSMFLAKFKEKSFIYQRGEQAESLYVILNGKIGLYKRSADQEQQEQVVFLSEGNSFGQAYRWKQKFLPLTFEETLLAVVPKRQLPKIAVIVAQQRQMIVNALAESRLFGSAEELSRVQGRLTLHRVPFGSYLIKQGEIPKGLFFLLKGSVSKRLELLEQEGRQELTVSHFSAGDFFPEQSLGELAAFSLVAESPCEVVSLPKGCLRVLGWVSRGKEFMGEGYYREQLMKEEEWMEFKRGYLQKELKQRCSK